MLFGWFCLSKKINSHLLRLIGFIDLLGVNLFKKIKLIVSTSGHFRTGSMDLAFYHEELHILYDCHFFPSRTLGFLELLYLADGYVCWKRIPNLFTGDHIRTISLNQELMDISCVSYHRINYKNHDTWYCHMYCKAYVGLEIPWICARRVTPSPDCRRGRFFFLSFFLLIRARLASPCPNAAWHRRHRTNCQNEVEHDIGLS